VFVQFMTETALITLASLVIGLMFAALVMPAINGWLGQPGAWPKTIHWGDSQLWIFLTTLFCIVILLAGSYPGGILAGFKPVLALKGSISTRQIGGISIRRGLIVFQFVLIQ